MKYNVKYIEPVMLFLFWLLCFAIISIIGISNVFALQYENVEGYQNNITVVLVAPDYSNSPINVPINSSLAFNQVREVIVQVDNFNFVANRNYQLELYLPQQDLGRANFYTVYGSNGESCLVSYDNSSFGGEYPRWAFQCPNSTNNITINIKNSSNQILWDDGPNGAPIFSWGYSYLRYSSTSLSGSGIVTDDIINNQNQNTQNIINNQNENTEKEIESQKVCETINKNYVYKNKEYLDIDGAVKTFSNERFGVTDYINIKNSKIKVLSTYSSQYVYMCFYDKNKIKISCIALGNLTINSDLSVPENSFYLRSSIYITTNVPQYKICKNGNQALNDNINNLNDNLNNSNSSGATNSAGDFFSGFTTDTFGLTSIITAPLNLIGSITSSTCTPLGLPLPYVNKTLELPCMSSIYSQYFGSFFNMYQSITFGIISYWVCIRIFNLVKDFKNPDHDEIEVLDL